MVTRGIVLLVVGVTWLKANQDMIEGYVDGLDLATPEPSSNRSHSYRHGFKNGRADRVGKPWTTATEAERFEPYQDSAFKGVHHHNGLCVLVDGMNGEYVAIGQVVAKTADHEGFNAPVAIQCEYAERRQVADLLAKEFGDLLQEMPPWAVQTLVLSHYR